MKEFFVYCLAPETYSVIGNFKEIRVESHNTDAEVRHLTPEHQRPLLTLSLMQKLFPRIFEW